MENKTAGHTPGPWRVHMADSDKTHSGDIAVYGHSKTNMGRCIARVYGEGFLSNIVKERDANARLIAAAPELLEECKKNLWWLQHVRSQIQGPKNVMLGFDQAIKYLGIVIAKAEGR